MSGTELPHLTSGLRPARLDDAPPQPPSILRIHPDRTTPRGERSRTSQRHDEHRRRDQGRAEQGAEVGWVFQAKGGSGGGACAGEGAGRQETSGAQGVDEGRSMIASAMRRHRLIARHGFRDQDSALWSEQLGVLISLMVTLLANRSGQRL